VSGDPAPELDPTAATLAALRAIARRVAVAERLESPGGEAILRSVVDAAARLIHAEAASIALHDPSSGRLVFRVAAGEQGQGVVGLSVEPGEGVAGYVFSSGEPLAIGETTVDPRFRRDAAERTGYVPRSLLAVPLADEAGTIGVLEVLDRRDGAAFDLADVEAATVFARQATVAIRATRLERDTAQVLRAALVTLDAAAPDGSVLGEDQVEEIVAAATVELDGQGDRDAGSGIWRLADAVARARDAAPEQVALVSDILDALARRAGRPAGRYRESRR
jgi:GAF domain-containing protein